MTQTPDRLALLRQAMTAEQVDLVVLGPGAHMQWLLGFHPHADERPSFVCITADSAMMLMPALNAEGSRDHTDLPMAEWSDDQGPESAFKRLLAETGAATARKIVLDETMRADFAALVTDHLPDATRIFTETTVGALRMRKDEGEYALLKKNALMADAAMRTGWEHLKAGVREIEVAGAIQASFKAQGAQPLFSIVGAGRNGAFPHHATGQTVIAEGQPVVMDIGGGSDGFSSDITRMAVIDTPPEGYDEVHAIVEASVQAAMQAARPGVQAKAVDAAARQVITDAGYGEFFVHRTGHGLGVEIHEPPYITATSDTVLEEGMVFSIEPGIYLPERFGIRLEDIVILRADGPEVFSELPRDLMRL
jgi:Xaa-Pro aminopeptidase